MREPLPNDRYKDNHGLLVTVQSVAFSRVPLAVMDIRNLASCLWRVLLLNSLLPGECSYESQRVRTSGCCYS